MSNTEMPKAYEPQQYEEDIYKQWEASGYFNPDNLPGDRQETYSIMMPPPNVTGVLHLGHALENTLMDIQARYQRMLGKKVLLLPGTDHAAVATQVKVENVLREAGMKNPREELGREGLLEKIREFSEDSKHTILNQIKRMGTSADWSRLAYTFDDERSAAVNKVFIDMYNDGLIYRGSRLINWSTGAQSVLSDDELEWEERVEPFYYIRCGDFVIGTVRSETKCADSPLVVHPTETYARIRFTDANGKADELIVIKELLDDEARRNTVLSLVDLSQGYEVVAEYTGAELEGQTFEYETYAGKRTFTVIADEVIKPEKGAGAMTISSSHSQDDYDLAKRRGLDETFIEKIDADGFMTQIAGPCAGMSVQEARKKSAQLMQEMGLLVGIDEGYKHEVPLCYRSHCVVEPRISTQWFVNVNAEISSRGNKTLKQLMQDAVRGGLDGNAEKQVRIMPDRFEKNYFGWIDSLQDWTISRQIWWGHRIPAWYNGEEMKVSVENPGTIDGTENNWTQDEDTLDTWFSSGMWPFSTLGYPEETEDLKTFFPTAWMQMGHEILFFWMARMILFSTYVLDEIPFRDVYIHGILRDKEGKKFSKSSGNGIDPIDVSNEHGTDALRLSLIKGITPGNDARYYEDKVVDARNFVNKLWNITRFVLSQEETEVQELSQADAWIQSRIHSVIAQTTQLLDDQQFSQASEVLYNFVWNEFADWYVELSKLQPNPQHTKAVLADVLKLLHPFIPYVTEVLWQQIGNSDLLLINQYPKAQTQLVNTELEQRFSQVQDLVIAVRNIRGQYKISYSNVFAVYSSTEISDEIRAAVEAMGKVTFAVGEAPAPATQLVAGEFALSVSLSGIIDMDAERERLQKEIAQLEKQIGGFNGKLSNASYVDNAPPAVVQETRDKLAEAETELVALQKTLTELS